MTRPNHSSVPGPVAPPADGTYRARFKQSSRVARHLAQAVQLEETGTAPLVRFTMMLASLACMAFLAWAGLTRIDEVAVAEGEVTPMGSVKTVQHLEGGQVGEILVHEGELVDRDQPLIKLLPAAALADLEQARAREIALLLKSERLRAFADGREPDFAFGTGYDRLVSDNVDIWQGLIRARDIARQGILAQIEQKRPNVRDLEQRLADQQAAALAHTMEDLGATITELAQVQESIGRLEDRVRRLVVSSPVRGYVKGLTVRNAGAVIQPGGVICDIVPVDRELKVDARVSPRHIGHVKPGQRVKVKVSAYDFARYGAIPGELTAMSATSFLNDRGEPYFKVQVKLDRNHVGDQPGMYAIMPGMTVEAEIVTGNKTLLQYMLRPIFTQARQSFHER